MNGNTAQANTSHGIYIQANGGNAGRATRSAGTSAQATPATVCASTPARSTTWWLGNIIQGNTAGQLSDASTGTVTASNVTT